MELMSRAFAVPALLLTLPLVAIGALSLHGLDLDYQTLNQTRTATALTSLRHADAAINARLTSALHAGWTLADQSDPTQDITGVRELVMTGKIAFAALYDQDRRLYPPDGGDSVLISDLNRLRQLEPQILAARAHSGATERTGLSRLGDRSVPFLCKPRDDGRDLCVVIGADALADAVTQGRRSDGADQWAVDVIDPDTPRHSSEPPTATLAASEPLRGWRLEARPTAPSPPLSPSLLSMTAVVIPLVAGWLALAWNFYRTHRQERLQARKRGEMISLLSHELRTPIANLTLYADLMRRRSDNPEAILRYCDILEDEIRRLGTLAENTLSLAKGETAPPRTEIAVPDQVAEQIVARFQPLLERAGCIPVVEGTATRPLSFDRQTFEQCLIALLDNARKYAPGSAIHVTTATSGDRLRLTVRDNGPGIPPTVRDHLFEPLTRGDHPGVEGFGLGLAAVRRLARSTGGEAISTPVDSGACFTVELGVLQSSISEKPTPCAS